MEYKIEKWESMDLLVHTKDFHAETSETEIPKFWDEYFANEEYRKIPGYLGVCAQKKTDGDEFKYGIGCKASDVEGIPDGFELIRIPEYSWAVFKCVGPSPKAIQEMWETRVQSLGQKDPLEEEMATGTSILAWETPRTEELGGGSQRVGHDLATEHTYTHLFHLNSLQSLMFLLPLLDFFLFQMPCN